MRPSVRLGGMQSGDENARGRRHELVDFFGGGGGGLRSGFRGKSWRAHGNGMR